MSSVPERPADAESTLAVLEWLAESGGLDELWWALTGVLLSAAEHMAPEAETPAEAAWIVAGRADPNLRPAAVPPAPKQREARPKPSRLAKWEASWQAEQSDEAQS